MKKLFMLIFVFYQFSSLLFGQSQETSYCLTSSKSSNYTLKNNLHFSNERLSNNSYCLKLYFHIIRRSDGTGGQHSYSVTDAFNILQTDFNPHDIYFNWDNTIDYIDADSYFNFSSVPNDNIYNVNNHEDGIDIYLFENSVNAFAKANGTGNSSELYVIGDLALTHVISHELGHVLFLFHTHYGTYEHEIIADVPDGKCQELVDGSNGDFCGDYVRDTPADPRFGGNNVNPSNCTWTSSGQDTNGDWYQPDSKNIMAYTLPSCMEYFTYGQGERMRNAISTLDYLQTINSSQSAPSADKISITSKGSYVLSDRTWTKLIVSYEGKSVNSFEWEWIIPNCSVRFGPQNTYADVRVEPMMSASSTVGRIINIQVRATNYCGNQSGWYAKSFEAVVSPGIVPKDGVIFVD